MNFYIKNIEIILSKRIGFFGLMFVFSKKFLKKFVDIFKERFMDYDVVYVVIFNEVVFIIDIKLLMMY